MWLLLLLSCLVFIKLSCAIHGDSDMLKPTLKYSYNGGMILVYDEIIHPLLGETLRHYLSSGEYRYSYLYPDTYEDIQQLPNDGNLHWRAFLSPAAFIKMRLWKPIKEACGMLAEEKRYLPYEITGTLLRRGDFTIPFQGDDETNNKIFLRIFLTPNMGKHAYSDQTFYDENDEIIASIYPKLYRVVVWTGDVKTLFRPPSMGFQGVEYSLFMKLSSDTELFHKAVAEYKIKKARMEEYKKMPFPFKNNVNKLDVHNINLTEKLLGKYHDSYGNVIAFFDNIFPKDFVDAVRTYYVKYESGLSYSPYDPASSETHDNVNWVIQLKPEAILNTPYIEVVKKLAAFLSNETGWYPYDVACNLIQHTHHTRIHIDCVSEEFEYTFLMYLNPNWTEDMYAETAFFEYDLDTRNLIKKHGREYVDSHGLEMFDFIGAAIPKFGRIAIFRNLIPHSARPPAPNFFAARYTFPVKVSESYRQARAKMLREALDYKTDNMPDDPLYEPLKLGDYEPYLRDERREWVEKHLQMMRDAKERKETDGLFEMENILFPKKFQPKRDEL